MDPLKSVASLPPAQRAFTLWGEFKKFAFKGNVIDLAVGVIIGAAFGKIVDSLVKHIIMPMVSLVMPSSQSYLDWKLPDRRKRNPLRPVPRRAVELPDRRIRALPVHQEVPRPDRSGKEAGGRRAAASHQRAGALDRDSRPLEAASRLSGSSLPRQLQSLNEPRGSENMQTRDRLLSWTIAAILLVSIAGADWPQFRGVGGQGVSREQNLPVTWGPDQNLAWKTELPGAGGSEPIVVGDRIFVSCYSGFGVPGESEGNLDNLRRVLVCLNRQDGIIQWTKIIPTRQPEQRSIREQHGYASSTPAADRDRVYAFFGKAGVFAFDHNGQQLWHAGVGDELHGWGSAASPVLVGDLVIINASVESQSLVALNKASGTEVWRAEGIRESWNTPLLISLPGGGAELVVAVQGKVLAFEPATGKPLWNCDTDIGWYMVPSVVASEGIVYCIGGRSGIAALAVRAGGRGDVTSSRRLWTGRKGSNVSSPIIHDGHLYWMNDNLGIAYCADATTGEILYEQRVGGAGQVYASPLLAEGRLYYLARNGRTYVLAARPQFEQLAVNDLGERGVFNSGLIAAFDRLYLRSNRFLYCLAKQQDAK